MFEIDTFMRSQMWFVFPIRIRAQLWQPDSWPAREPVSFGRMFAQRTGGDAAAAAAVDARIEADYRNNL